MKYYTDLLGTSFNSSADVSGILGIATIRKVPEDMKRHLMQHVTMVEIKVSLASIHKDSSPGPNGFNAAFYQDNWEIVGVDLVQAIDQFFITGEMTRQWNSTCYHSSA